MWWHCLSEFIQWLSLNSLLSYSIFFASLLELNSALASTRPYWMSLAVIHLWSRSNVGFWMIPFIPWRDYFLPHSLLKALYISSLLLHNFSLPARWVTFSPSLFRHSHFLHIHVYVGFFNASSILSLTAAFSYKWLSLDSNRKEKVLFCSWGSHLVSASRVLFSLLFHSVDLG